MAYRHLVLVTVLVAAWTRVARGAITHNNGLEVRTEQNSFFDQLEVMRHERQDPSPSGGSPSTPTRSSSSTAALATPTSATQRHFPSTSATPRMSTSRSSLGSTGNPTSSVTITPTTSTSKAFTFSEENTVSSSSKSSNTSNSASPSPPPSSSDDLVAPYAAIGGSSAAIGILIMFIYQKRHVLVSIPYPTYAQAYMPSPEAELAAHTQSSASLLEVEQEAYKVFEWLDRDKDGKATATEIADRLNISETQATSLIVETLVRLKADNDEGRNIGVTMDFDGDIDADINGLSEAYLTSQEFAALIIRYILIGIHNERTLTQHTVPVSQMQQYKTMFACIDADGDGLITHADIVLLASSSAVDINLHGQHPHADSHIQQQTQVHDDMFAALDFAVKQQLQQQLDFDSFVSLMYKADSGRAARTMVSLLHNVSEAAELCRAIDQHDGTAASRAHTSAAADSKPPRSCQFAKLDLTAVVHGVQSACGTVAGGSGARGHAEAVSAVQDTDISMAHAYDVAPVSMCKPYGLSRPLSLVDTGADDGDNDERALSQDVLGPSRTCHDASTMWTSDTVTTTPTTATTATTTTTATTAAGGFVFHPPGLARRRSQVSAVTDSAAAPVASGDCSGVVSACTPGAQGNTRSHNAMLNGEARAEITEIENATHGTTTGAAQLSQRETTTAMCVNVNVNVADVRHSLLCDAGEVMNDDSHSVTL